MAELGLDCLDARALGDEQAGASVAKVMEPQPVGESRLDGCWLEDPGNELLLPQRTTLRRGEHQILRAVRPLGQVGGELLAEEPRQRYGDAAGAPRVVSVLGAFAIGFTFRIVAMHKGWEEPLAALLPEPPTDQRP